MRGKRYFCYYEISEKCELGEKGHYKSKLGSFERIGTIYEAEKIAGGVKDWKVLSDQAPEGSAGFDSILDWSLMEREAIESLERISRAKKGYGRTVDVLIKELKDATWSLDSRAKKAAFARYVFEKLI